MKTVCLSMIVKNEASVLERCITSIRPYINHWVISDTGSDDNTLETIENISKKLALPVDIYQDKWVDFSHNRNLSLSRCSGKSDYILVMDADEILEDDPYYELPLQGDWDAYHCWLGIPEFEYSKIRFIRNDGTWKYEQPLHEYLNCTKPHKIIKTQIKFKEFNDSARSKSGTKILWDALQLEKEIQKNPNNARLVFYLAQSYEGIKAYHPARETFKKRIELKGWEEEVYYSLYRLAEIDYILNQDILKSIDLFLNAYHYRPHRLEALLSLCEKLRGIKAWATLYYLSENKREIRTNDILFVNKVAEWRIVDEHALAAFYLGKKKEAKEGFEFILDNYKLNNQDQSRIIKNLEYI